MENLYQAPKKGSTKQEREFFWRRVTEEQKASGMSSKKFCHHHHIPLSTFKNRKYRLQTKEKQNGSSKDSHNATAVSETPNFIPVQIADELISDAPTEKNISDIRIKISFKNGHAIEFLSLAEASILSKVIIQVSRLSC
jgi:hypothetical protein